MTYTKQTWVDGDTSKPISAARLSNMEQGIADAHTLAAGSAGSVGTEVRFSTLVGSTDDEKLTSFMSSQASQTKKGTTLVLDEPRDYTFAPGHQLYSGFSIRGAFRPQDQPRSSQPIGNKVLIRGTGGLFTLSSGNTFGVSITNMSIDGTSSNRLVDGRSDAVLWTSVFRDISIQNSAGVLGSPSQSLLVTACTVDGWWNVNNIQTRAFCFSGSDFYFNPSMMLLDSPNTLLGPTNYLMSLQSQSNCWVSNIYCTAEGHSGLLITGGASDESLWIKNCVWEGRNGGTTGDTSPTSPGSIVRIQGGQVIFRDNRFAFGMSNPSATGRDDSGVIHISGGNVLIDGATYRRAATVGESIPFIYVTGTNTRVRVRNIISQGTWTGLPIVRQATAGLVDADNSVTLTTG